MGDKQPYVTTTYGGRGYFAVMMWWNPEHGGFWEPWNTSDWSHESRAAAEDDAKCWAEADGLEYRPGAKLEARDGK